MYPGDQTTGQLFLSFIIKNMLAIVNNGKELKKVTVVHYKNGIPKSGHFSLFSIFIELNVS